MSKARIKPYTDPTSTNQDARIEYNLKQLSMWGMLPVFTKYAEENIETNSTPKDYLERLLEVHRVFKENERIDRGIKRAKFKEIQTFAEFKFYRLSTINQKQVRDLAKCTFIDKKKNVVLLGWSGVGKTHIAKAIGIEAITQGKDVRFVDLDDLIRDLTYKYRDSDSRHKFLATLEKPDLLILDEVKGKTVSPTVAELLYQLIDQRYQQKATIFTTNKSFSEWGKLFGEDTSAAIDRVIDKNLLMLVKIEAPSFRADRGETDQRNLFTNINSA
jgi:DNA replication protein DnaC